MSLLCACFPTGPIMSPSWRGSSATGSGPTVRSAVWAPRKFVRDLDLVRNIRRVYGTRGILVLYPEARYANVGTSSLLPPSTAKLIRYLKVPVVAVT